MPNIEIHGLSPSNSDILAGQITHTLFNLPVAEDIVITVCNDVVLNLRAEEKPFLRVIVVGSNAMEAQQILDKLKPLGLDIEFAMIHSFIPKVE